MEHQFPLSSYQKKLEREKENNKPTGGRGRRKRIPEVGCSWRRKGWRWRKQIPCSLHCMNSALASVVVSWSVSLSLFLHVDNDAKVWGASSPFPLAISRLMISLQPVFQMDQVWPFYPSLCVFRVEYQIMGFHWTLKCGFHGTGPPSCPPKQI